MSDKKQNAGELLASAAETYRQRNAIYGDNYKHFGYAMAALFPSGLTATTPDEWNRLGVFVQCVSKISRIAENLPTGGHLDSSHDLAVYAAMSEELTAEGSIARPIEPTYMDGVRAAIEAIDSIVIFVDIDDRPTPAELKSALAKKFGLNKKHGR